MKTMADMKRKINAKGRKDANRWCVSELLAADAKKKAAPPGMGGHYAAMVQLAA